MAAGFAVDVVVTGAAVGVVFNFIVLVDVALGLVTVVATAGLGFAAVTVVEGVVLTSY